MGLDITVVTKWRDPIEPATEYEDAAGDYIRGSDWNDPEFAARGEGLPEKSVVVAEQGTGFCAGAYSRYNRWRNQLARLALYPEKTEKGTDTYLPARTGHDVGAWMADSGPFWELINFTDCGGTIGPVVCQKLLKDFDDFALRAAHFDWPEPGQAETFHKFHQAFREAAAANGAVIFH